MVHRANKLTTVESPSSLHETNIAKHENLGRDEVSLPAHAAPKGQTLYLSRDVIGGERPTFPSLTDAVIWCGCVLGPTPNDVLPGGGSVVKEYVC